MSRYSLYLAGYVVGTALQGFSQSKPSQHQEIKMASTVKPSQSMGATRQLAWRSQCIGWAVLSSILSLTAGCGIFAPPQDARSTPAIATPAIATPLSQTSKSPSGLPVPNRSASTTQTSSPKADNSVPSSKQSSRQSSGQSSGQSANEIWSFLRQGRGIVVMLRHAIAPGTGDPANFRLEDCSTQRNLSAAGRQQAIQIGAMLRQQRIPVARVLSSQWCRCLETARLMDIAPVEPFPVINSFFGDRSTEAKQTAELQQFIEENRGSAGVIFLVTHQVNITAVTGIVPEQGEALILRADQPNQPQVLGKVLLGN